MEFKASASYWRNLWKTKDRFELHHVFIPLGAVFIRENTWVILLVLILLSFVTSRLARKITATIRIDGDYFEVEYRRFFKMKIIRIHRSGILLKLMHYEEGHRFLSFPSYYVVLVYDNNKLKYEIDSQDGFSKETLVSLITTFAKGRAC